jgi:AcrR family transcriptional regulator
MPRLKRKKSNLAVARERMYRELVFECAERVFAEKGFVESSMQDLAAEAGISLKTLYATFPGKDDIYKEILRVRGLGLLAAIGEVKKPDSAAMAQFEVGIHGIVGFLIDHQRFFRILLQEGQAWGLNPRGEEAQATWEAGLVAVREILVGGIESGEFLPADPDLLAPTVSAILQVQLAGLLDRGDDADAEAISGQILETLRRLLCGGSEETAALAS